MGKVREAPALA
jgi:hypothetical protein